MTRLFSRLLCPLLILCALLTLAACHRDPLVGTYQLVSAQVGTTVYDTHELKPLGFDPEKYSIQFKANGTAILCDGLTKQKMLWAEDKIWPEENTAKVATFTLEGNRVTLTQSGTVLIFEK